MTLIISFAWKQIRVYSLDFETIDPDLFPYFQRYTLTEYGHMCNWDVANTSKSFQHSIVSDLSSSNLGVLSLVYFFCPFYGINKSYLSRMVISSDLFDVE